MPLPRSIHRRFLTSTLALFIVSAIAIGAQNQRDSRVKTDLRDISGIITDSTHEPVRNAVVELENPSNHEVISYITAADGHYIFHRLDSHVDFRIWATFRGNKSTIHNISMYDDHLDKIINIIVKTY